MTLINSKSQVDNVDIVELHYHGDWYTLLKIEIIDSIDLERLTICYVEALLKFMDSRLRWNVWETTRCPFSEFSWFFGVNKRSRFFAKVDEILRCTSPWPSWPSGQFSRWLEGQDDFS